MFLEDMKNVSTYRKEKRGDYLFEDYKYDGDDDVCITYRDGKLILITLHDLDGNVFAGLFTEVSEGPNEYTISDYCNGKRGWCGHNYSGFSKPMVSFIEKYKPEKINFFNFLIREYNIKEKINKIYEKIISFFMV
jgi:hypothetical protein